MNDKQHPPPNLYHLQMKPSLPKHTSGLMKDATYFLSDRVQSPFSTSPLTFTEASAN